MRTLLRLIGLAVAGLLCIGATVLLVGFALVAVVAPFHGEWMPLFIVGLLGLIYLAAWALVDS